MDLKDLRLRPARAEETVNIGCEYKPRRWADAARRGFIASAYRLRMQRLGVACGAARRDTLYEASGAAVGADAIATTNAR